MKRMVILAMALWVGQSAVAQVEPTWESMADNYEVPEWFLDGKLGVWFHWGIPSAIDEDRPNDDSHYGRRMYGLKEYWSPKGAKEDLDRTAALTQWHTERYGHPSEFGYEKLIPMFKAEKWDPDALVKFCKDNGAHFIMPVACHHDNFDMYDSSHSWNSVDMGPKRDTLKEWKAAAQKHGLKFGVSTHLYWSPKFFSAARKYQKRGTPGWEFFNMDYDPAKYASQDRWNEHWYKRCWEIIEKYDPDWFNNDCPYPNERTGKSLGLQLFSSYLNRDRAENGGSQTVVFSAKGGKDKRAYTPNVERGGSADIQAQPWMWATDLSGNWFYRKDAVNKMSIPVMVGNAVDAISKNGVVMLNIALKGDGTIPANQAAYLTAFGDFLKTSGEGIYGTRPWTVFGEGPTVINEGRQQENLENFVPQDIRFTVKGDALYAFVLARPTEDIVIKTLAKGGVYADEVGAVELLGSDETLAWTRSAEALTISLPKTLPDDLVIGFRITSVRAQKRAARYPAFSWDTVPVAFHFGNSPALLTEAEAKFVATRSNFICLEKGHASGQFKDTETGIEMEARQLKALNPDMKVIFYWNAFLDYPMFQAHQEYQQHPEWWLKTVDGQVDIKPNTRLEMKRYDLSNPEFRDWWAGVARKAVVEGSCDGVFMDAFPQVASPDNIPLWGQEKYDAIQQGLKEIIWETRQKIGEDKLIVYNGIRSTPTWQVGYDYPEHTDAAMIEHFGHFNSGSKECMLKDILEMERACKNGRIVVFKGWSGFTFIDGAFMRKSLAEKQEIARKSITFPLAAFLVGAQENSYFIYNWGYRMEMGCLEWYPEFDKPLGEPLGDMVREGWTLRREFEHASVWVDLESKDAKIIWQKQRGGK
ncbi:Alpha-L-fucosidase [Novipirellula aureliae]|uniref:alpha-L-fucosidase n=1 Tax=Novipirellula aureliae TaxID=2527966 RepID=A0A5C6E915_9BACT|nr:alpha-L-fucosidase [Novipirellula aureliae]TWU44377.1 Alpha-L-fucosidase [Novipirellula aureliae]